jgi:hypothetical protein
MYDVFKILGKLQICSKTFDTLLQIFLCDVYCFKISSENLFLQKLKFTSIFILQHCLVVEC